MVDYGTVWRSMVEGGDTEQLNETRGEVDQKGERVESETGSQRKFETETLKYRGGDVRVRRGHRIVP